MKRDPTEPVVLHVRTPSPLVAAVDQFSRQCGLSRSEAVRYLLVNALERVQLWPPMPTLADPA